MAFKFTFYFAERAEDGTKRKLRNFYSGVAESEDVSKLVVLLSSSMNSIREIASEALQDFQKYKVLWTEDRDAKIQVSLMLISCRAVCQSSFHNLKLENIKKKKYEGKECRKEN